MEFKRIIPCLDVAAGRVVKGVQFLSLRDAGDPVDFAKKYERDGADELVFLDITGQSDHRAAILELLRRIVESISIPLTFGGGIRSLSDIEQVLATGANKVSINSAAVRDETLLAEASNRYGSERIVLAIDAKKRDNGEDGWEVYTSGGRQATGLDVVDWAIRGTASLGAGEILLTSMDADGTESGYDYALTRAVAEAVDVPVIASGGAGKLEHFYNAFAEGRASAALAASLFHFDKCSVGEVKRYLRAKGVAVR